jgi:AcrR family transcriptional regulator
MNPDDPRVRRTRARLKDAVLCLAAAKDLGAITMSEVAQRAEVNRATVYQHYPDVDAIVTDAMHDTVAHVARAAALCPIDAPRDTAPEPLMDLFTGLAAHLRLHRRMFGASGSALFATRMREHLTEELARSFLEGKRPTGFGDVPVDLHAAYLAGALTGVIAHWLTADAPAPADEIALAFWRLFLGRQS